MKWQSGLRSLRNIASSPRIVGILGALGILLSGATAAHAQFRPIPNYVGIGAGAQFRNDINNHLSGAASVAPRMVSLPLGQLPSEQDGQEYWCADCKQTNPCVGGGLGALALGWQGGWSCTSGATLPNGFPLSIDVSAAAHRIQGLAPNTVTGDALSQGQSHLNDLTTATANYNMGMNRLQNLNAGAVAGDALGYGQSGASLNGLNLNSNTLTGLAPATVSGDALSYAQNGAQLTTNQAPVNPLVSNADNATNSSPMVISAPASIVAGNALVAIVDVTSATGVLSAPAGFTQLRTDSTALGNGMTAAFFCKTATGSEPASYSFSSTVSTNVQGAVIQLKGVSCTMDGAGSVGAADASAATAPAFTTTLASDYVLTQGSYYGGVLNTASIGQVLDNQSAHGFAATGYVNAASPTAAVTYTASAGAQTQLVSQVALESLTTIQNLALVMNQKGAQLQSLNASVNNVLNVMAPPYGALGDGNTDDTNAIQGAINFALTGSTANPASPISNATATAVVYLPAPPVCYLHTKPIRTYGINLEVRGDTGTKLCQNYIGEALIDDDWGTAKLPYAVALVGSGNSMVSATGQLGESIDLARAINGTGTANLNTNFATGFNIAFFMKATAAGGQILGSHPAYPGTGNGAYSFNYNGANQVIWTVNTITGGLITVGTCPAQTLGSIYEIEGNWDGATYSLWQGTPGGTAVSCGTAVSANRMTQGIFEEEMVPDGGPHEFWPDGSSNNDNAFVGNLDSIRFEGVSVHTAAYTVPNAKFTADWKTFYLTNFETSLDGTQLGYTFYGKLVYSTVLDSSGVIGSTANNYYHDFDLCSSLGNGTNAADGMFIAYSNNSKWTNLSCTNAYYAQADLFNNDYLARLENWSGYGGHVGLNFGAAWNDSLNSNAGVDGVDGACVVNQGGIGAYHDDQHSHCVDRGSLRYGMIANQTASLISDFYIDQEVASPNFVAWALLNMPNNTTVFTGGLAQGGNTGVYVLQDNGGSGSIFTGTIFGTFGAPPEVIDYTNGSPTSPAMLINPTLPNGVPLSNQAGNPNILTLGNGQSSMMQSLELQQVPKFDAGLAHLTVNPITDPAAATISVVGGAGSTSYGPYFIVCHDVNGGVTLPSGSSNTVANGPTTLSNSNYINITWSAVSGCATFDILKGSTSTALAIGATGTSYHDVGGSTGAYAAPIRNTTGDLSGLAQISTGMTFAKLPGTVVNGMRVYCTNCDPPVNPPAACTSSGARTGAFADGINNNWLCVP